ncbi:hypothetical protein C8F01DRAFT_1120297 [Mycena amicta]|nr:hypothetical protein C8F01DRAFT_1120297 [Mycena amicta]
MDSASADGSAFDAELPSVAPVFAFETPPDPDTLPELEPADWYRMNLWTLTQRNRPILSLEEMKNFLETPQDAVLRRESSLRELDHDFEEDLDQMYLAESEDYLEEAKDMFHAFELAKQKQLEELKSNFSGSPVWDHVYAHVYSTYQLKKKGIIEEPEPGSTAAAVMPSLIDFPQTVADYHAASTETQQLSEKDKVNMLNKYIWAWWQTTPLQEALETDPEFREMIHRGQHSDPGSRDPRRRTSMLV